MSIPWNSLKKVHDILVGKADGLVADGHKFPHVLSLVRVDTDSGAITHFQALDPRIATHIVSDQPRMVSRIRQLLTEDAALGRDALRSHGFLPNVVMQFCEVQYTEDAQAGRASPPPGLHPNTKTGLFVCVHTAAESFPALHPILDQPTRHVEFRPFPAQSCELAVFLAARSLTDTADNGESSPDEKLWQANYEARKNYFEKTVGPLPSEILKMLNMAGVWPRGGLSVIPAPSLGQNLSVYTTFGLTNPDMPTTVQMSNFHFQSEGNRTTEAGGTLSQKQPAPKRAGFAGYGYEILMVTQCNEQWPLNFLQWAVTAEIGHDVGLLARVEKYGGFTVEQIQVGQGQTINVLIAKAQAPLPVGTSLPAGKMEILVATTITDQEMKWSQSNGRDPLLKKLQEAGVGQISVPNRKSVV